MLKLESVELFAIHEYVNYDEGIDSVLGPLWKQEDPELYAAAKQLKEAREHFERLLEMREVPYEEE